MTEQIILTNHPVLTEDDSDVVELKLLRTFYEAWSEFHKIPLDDLHKHKKHAAALRINDARGAVDRFNRLYKEAA